MALCKKKTEKLWLWRAYDPIARRTIAWVLGRRDDATCQKLLNKIGLEGKTFVTDDWEGYHRLIPDDQLFTGKDLTVPIEQDNSNIRHFLARFRRRTKVVSKVVEMVDLSLRIYHHFHDNLDAFAETLGRDLDGIGRARAALKPYCFVLKRDWMRAMDRVWREAAVG